MPGTFTDVIELLIPELQRRGIFWDNYTVPGGTYRENLTETKGQREPREDHPAAAKTWRVPSNDGKVNGIHGTETKGFTNGWPHDDADKIEERLDPMTMQLC